MNAPLKEIGHYAIKGTMATTSTATIYEAVDLKCGRKVVLKVLRPEVEGDLVFYNRFCREREIGLRLNHPSVVKVYAECQPTEIYMAMEPIEGLPLRRILIAEGKLDVARSVRIAVGVCEALDYIHSQGVVHRDLKPENIMIGTDEKVTLIDFGIASLAGARRLTFGRLSEVMGTADYISPEQVKGRRGDNRSDLYALGIIIYEMLTGDTPFSGSNPFVVMNNRLVNDAEPPKHLEPTIPTALDQIVIRLLARDPRERYQNCQMLLWDLGHPVETAASTLDRSGLDDQQKSGLNRLFSLSYWI